MSRFQLLMLVVYTMLKNDDNYDNETKRALAHAYATQWAAWKNTWAKSWYVSKATQNAWENEDKYPKAEIVRIAGETFQVWNKQAKPLYRKNIAWSNAWKFDNQVAFLKNWEEFVDWIEKTAGQELEDFKNAVNTRLFYNWWKKVRDNWREFYELKFARSQLVLQ